jgi:hypothetical protein
VVIAAQEHAFTVGIAARVATVIEHAVHVLHSDRQYDRAP